IQYVRFAPLLAGRGAKVVIECRAELVPLLRTADGVQHVFARGEASPRYHAHGAIDSLPGIMGTRLETVPAQVPYLHPPGELIETWRGVVGRGDAETRGRGEKKMWVGVCWQGEQKLVHLRKRSFAAHELLPLARVPGVTLVSLQHGPRVPDGLPITVLPGLDHQSITFLDTAAVMKSLDLVVTCDTSIAHLAGALGVTVWVALPFASCGRWMLSRDDSPWYPSLRLFRQERPNEWGPVFAGMAA